MAVEQPLGEEGFGERFWLKKGRESFVFFFLLGCSASRSSRHPGVPARGAFNVFVVKLSARESQHSSWWQEPECDSDIR